MELRSLVRDIVSSTPGVHAYDDFSVETYQEAVSLGRTDEWWRGVAIRLTESSDEVPNLFQRLEKGMKDEIKHLKAINDGAFPPMDNLINAVFTLEEEWSEGNILGARFSIKTGMMNVDMGVLTADTLEELSRLFADYAKDINDKLAAVAASVGPKKGEQL